MGGGGGRVRIPKPVPAPVAPPAAPVATPEDESVINAVRNERRRLARQKGRGATFLVDPTVTQTASATQLAKTMGDVGV